MHPKTKQEKANLKIYRKGAAITYGENIRKRLSTIQQMQFQESVAKKFYPKLKEYTKQSYIERKSFVKKKRNNLPDVKKHTHPAPPMTIASFNNNIPAGLLNQHSLLEIKGTHYHFLTFNLWRTTGKTEHENGEVLAGGEEVGSSR